MNIRLAKLKDLKAIVEIYNQAILSGKSTADTEIFTREEKIPWFESHQNSNFPLYVVVVNDEVIGYVYLTAYRPGRKAMRYTAEVSYYLRNDFHRKGIGTSILEFIIIKAKELNFKTLVAILLEVNIGSIKLLEKFNFDEWGCLIDIADFKGNTCSHLYYGLKL